MCAPARGYALPQRTSLIFVFVFATRKCIGHTIHCAQRLTTTKWTKNIFNCLSLVSLHFQHPLNAYTLRGIYFHAKSSEKRNSNHNNNNNVAQSINCVPGISGRAREKSTYCIIFFCSRSSFAFFLSFFIFMYLILSISFSFTLSIPFLFGGSVRFCLIPLVLF